MLSTFLIALREGLEASLIVGIFVAYVVKTNRRQLLKPLWIGVGISILLSLAVGAVLSFTSAQLTDQSKQIFAGATSFAAVALVTWMVFWMKRTARTLKNELQGKVDKALLAGPLALALAAFFAVAREGLETALFIYSNFQAVAERAPVTIGLITGLASAVALGYLIYSRSIKMNLGKFFMITGVALIVIAAGVFSYGVHEFQEVGWLPGPDAFIWDVTHWIAPDSILAALMGGTFGFDTTTSYLQFVIWGAYLAITLAIYLLPGRKAQKISA
jgi:high-affinity iron transporter